MKKQKFLYHGSPHKNIEELKPQSRPHRPEDGELLYATPNIDLASVFMVSGKAHCGCGKFGKVRYAWIIADRDEFVKSDKGGHIYVLPSKTFKTNPKSILGEEEYVSAVSVKPVKIMEYRSSIDVLVKNKVQLYFLRQEVYEKIKASKDHGYSIFRKLKSENQVRNINVKKL